MNSQFPPLNNQVGQQQQQQQQQPKQQPPPQQNTFKQYPTFYIQPNTFPIPNIPQQTVVDNQNSWFVCHPVMPNDPFFSYLSQVSNFIQNPQTFKNEAPIKLEVDEDIPKPLIQNQACQSQPDKKQQQQRLPQSKNQTKIKRTTDYSIASNIQPCKCSQSNCLKRYCQCFQNGRECIDECQCIDCKNSVQFLDERNSTNNRKSYRNKNIPLQTNNGCKCRSSGCIKKYCECFKKGQVCVEMCSCQDCQNIPFIRNSKEELKKKIKIQND